MIELLSKPSGNILDVGCATGSTGRSLKRINPEIYLCGIEYNDELGVVAKRHYDEVIIGDLDLLDLDDLPKRKFDVVFAGDVLEHTNNPSANLNKMKSVCKTEAEIVLSLPNVQHITVIFNLLRGIWPERDRGIFDKTHLRWFTLKSIETLANDNGLKLARLKRHYRFTDKPSSKLNRLARFFHFGVFKNFLTYQYVVVLVVST